MYENERDKGIITPKAYELINEYVSRLNQNNIPVIFNLRHLRKILRIAKKDQNYYFGKEKGMMYKSFCIPKKTGGYRVIEAPADELKIKQRWIKDNIIDQFRISEHAIGFRKDYSIYHNALPHVNKELVINVDIENFFSSIKYNQILRFFTYIGYNMQTAHLLTKLCTNKRNCLPQGSPASPSLSNILLLKMDKRLVKLAESVGASYTRYADDITFSGNKRIKSVVPLIITIINDEGYKINEKKLRLQYSNQRQIVTGLIVNKKVSVPKNRIKELEHAIYYGKKYGIIDHMKKIDCEKSFYKEYLYGMAYFIKMIEFEKGEKYLDELNKIIWAY